MTPQKNFHGVGVEKIEVLAECLICLLVVIKILDPVPDSRNVSPNHYIFIF